MGTIEFVEDIMILFDGVHGTIHTLEQFHKFMEGQTYVIHNGEALYYIGDVWKFLYNQPITD